MNEVKFSNAGKTHFSIQSALTVGFIATIAMTAFTHMAPLMGFEMNIPKMLSSTMGAPLAVGWIAHFMIGGILAVGYAAIFFVKIDPMSYNPSNGIKYFPHKIAVTESIVSSSMPPKPTSFTVTDAASNLWDQILYLWGTISFQNMTNPNNFSDTKHLAYKSVFDGDPFPADMSTTGTPGLFDLFEGTNKVLTLNA